MTAADVRYGRRGGGWVPSSTFTPGDGVGDIDRMRRRREIAHEKNPAKTPAWPDVTKLEKLWLPETLDEWEGRARMAAAREAAGQPLDAIDHQALAIAEADAS